MDEPAVESLFDFKKPPILLLGSGITRRYAADAFCWEGLLRRIAARVGIDDIVPFRNFADRNQKGMGLMPRLAVELQDEIDRLQASKQLAIKDILTEDEFEIYDSSRADVVKILAARECSALRIDPDSQHKDEIELLRRMPDVIPCVVTTNYDTIVEKELFGGRFKVYSRVSDYYLSGSQGIGEVYKIHGTCEDPSTLILDERDYQRFQERAKIVSAKILSVLCDYPMVIMGYSSKDPDVNEILTNLIVSLDDEKLRQVEKNIVFIDYEPGQEGFELVKSTIRHDGHQLTFRAYRTDNFSRIYEEILSMEPAVSPESIRKIRQVVRDIQLVEKSRGVRYKPIGIDDITQEDSDKLVVIITDQDGLKVIESIPPISVNCMIKDILGVVSYKGDAESVVTMFTSNGSEVYNMNAYVPIFHYMNQTNPEAYINSQYARKFITEKARQYRGKIQSIRIPKTITDLGSFELDDCIAVIGECKEYLKPLVVMHLLSRNEISEELAIELLRYIYDNAVNPLSSNMRCAVSYVGFKKFMENGRGSWVDPKSTEP